MSLKDIFRIFLPDVEQTRKRKIHKRMSEHRRIAKYSKDDKEKAIAKARMETHKALLDTDTRDKYHKYYAREKTKTNKRESEKRPEREWAIERLIKKGLTEEQIKSLEPWLEFLKQELYPFDYKAYFLNGIMKSEEGRNGSWRKRQEDGTEVFPSFDADKANRVFTRMSDIMSLYSMLKQLPDQDKMREQIMHELEPNIPVDNIREEIADALLSNSFVRFFQAVDKLTKPKEYINFNPEPSWQKFSFEDAMYGQEREEIAKQLAKSCENSLSFCIAGKTMATNYLKRGDIYLMTRTAENADTKESDVVPRVAIFVSKDIPPRVIEFHGNEAGQDISPEDIAEIFEKAKLEEGSEGSIPGLNEFVDDNQERFKNVLIIDDLTKKIKKMETDPEYDLDISDLKKLYKIGGDINTFTLLNYPPKIGSLKNLRNSILRKRLEEYSLNHKGIKPTHTPEQQAKEDMARIYDTTPERVALKPTEVNELTEVMIGNFNLVDPIFQKKFEDNLFPNLRVVVGPAHLIGLTDPKNLEEITGFCLFDNDPSNYLNNFGKLKIINGVEITDDVKKRISSGDLVTIT
jgi:hypothetical protein